jgi:hypothetical protein
MTRGDACAPQASALSASASRSRSVSNRVCAHNFGRPCLKGLSSGVPAAAWQPPDRLYNPYSADDQIADGILSMERLIET